MIDIISITKDDFDGIIKTIESTRLLRSEDGIKQIIIDSSAKEIADKINIFVSNEKNLEYFWEEPRGIATAFNSGIAKSTSDWVWFLNGGDEVLNDLDVNTFLGLIKKNRSDMIVFDIEFLTGLSKKPPLHSLWPLVYNWVSHPGTIMKRELLLQNGGFDEKYKIAMDGDLFMKLLNEDTSIDLISIPIVKYAGGGLSDNIQTTAAEVTVIIQKNSWKIFVMWLSLGYRIFSAYMHFKKNRNKKND